MGAAGLVEVARRRVAARRGAFFGGAAAVEDEAALRVGAFRVAGFLRAAVFAGRLAVRLAVLSARRVERAGAPAAALRAICRTCLLSPSMRFSAFSTSACLAVLRIWTWNWSIAIFSVFWPSLIERSTCRRMSGGTRLSAC